MIKSTDVKANIEAAARIFEEYGDFIYRVIRYKTTDKSLVDDLFQDLFLSLAANPMSLQGAELKAYLYRVIINDIRDATRRVKSYRKLLGKYVENHRFSINEIPLRNASTREERVDAIIRETWNELSPKETKAICLHYLEGYSITEIANNMKIRPASVSQYICVGLKKMRQCLRQSVKDKA